MIKHPSCTTREREEPCADPYCPIHGRIRDMDAGASPFINVDAIAAQAAADLGMTAEDVSEAYVQDEDGGGTDYSRRLRREASEADARIEEMRELKFHDRFVGDSTKRRSLRERLLEEARLERAWSWCEPGYQTMPSSLKGRIDSPEQMLMWASR